MTLRYTLLIALAGIAACGADHPPEESYGPDDTPAAVSQAAEDTTARPEYLASEENPSAGDILPMPFRVIWEPWRGDFDGMVERRVIRAVVPFGGYQFYYVDGLPKGAAYDLLQRLEEYVNEELGRRNIKVYVVVIPVSRDELIPAMLNGHADLVAGDNRYTATLSVTATTSGTEPFTVSRGMRVAQLVVADVRRAAWREVEDLDESARGDGGFGSTGLAGRGAGE